MAPNSMKNKLMNLNRSLQHPHFDLKEAYLKGFNSLVSDTDKSAWVYLGDSADNNTPLTNFNVYVEELLLRETRPPQGFVCDTIWWAIIGDVMVGRISFRHELNEFLKRVGGHIGYVVHPKWRNQGIATWMLGEVLKSQRVKSCGRVLLTCDEFNLASEKTILRNGGVFDRHLDMGPDRPRKKHFWINVE